MHIVVESPGCGLGVPPRSSKIRSEEPIRTNQHQFTIFGIGAHDLPVTTFAGFIKQVDSDMNYAR